MVENEYINKSESVVEVPLLGKITAGNPIDAIEISATRGTDVSLALIDVIEQLKTAKKMAEERKRLNGESMRMTVILVK